MKHNLTALLDEVEQKFRLTGVSTDIQARRTSAMPTGLLSLDVMLSGGIPPGRWVTVYGGEGSGKSTLLATLMERFASNGVSGAYYDYEGTLDPVYLGNLLSQASKLQGSALTPSQLFGIKNERTGKWDCPPIIRLYTESIGDAMFDAMSSLARHLPDKVYHNGKWYYVFEELPEGEKAVKSLSSRGSYYVEASHPYAELVIFLDSYMMMYPESLDTDDKKGGLAAIARMFSENIPKIAGRLQRKGITVVGVNQLRLKPGVSYGNPEYEPGGTAVQFASAVRIKVQARSVPHGKGLVEEEQSILGEGSDQYKYVNVKVTKNKSATSVGLESWQRIWAADASGNASGFCPVWNIYDYLVMTGQAERFGTGKAKEIRLQLRDAEDGNIVFSSPSFSYYDLKSLVLLPELDRRKFAKSLGMSKTIYETYFSSNLLYTHCRNQIQAGLAITWAYRVRDELGIEVIQHDADGGTGTEEQDDPYGDDTETEGVTPTDDATVATSTKKHAKVVRKSLDAVTGTEGA